jgi:hypothetical protein
MSYRQEGFSDSINREQRDRPPFFMKIFCFTLLLLSVTSLFGARRNQYPLDSSYHRPEDILPSLEEITAMNPGLVSWEIIGESSNEKLPIYALRISNPETGIADSKPSVLFHGQHHSEEPIGVELVFYLSRSLLSDYSTDYLITYLVDNYNLWFIPTINPEGFEIVNRGINRLKRKNITDYSFFSSLFWERESGRDYSLWFQDQKGVDLNRNYPFNWENDQDNFPASPYFKGFEPASQNEIRAMIDFSADNHFQLALFYHSSVSGSYSERIFFPWRWGHELSPDYFEMLYLAEYLARYLPRTYEEGQYIVHHYNTSKRGFARDYIYSQHRTMAMLIEVGGNSPYGEGIVNPSNEVLQIIKRNHTKAVLKLLEEYDKNLLIGRVVDKEGLALPGKRVEFKGRSSTTVKPIITNDEGYFFCYLPPDTQSYTLTIGGNHEFTVIRESEAREEYTFRLSESRSKPLLTEPLNNNEAIIMTNPVFQFFPPLKIQESGKNESENLILTLTSGLEIRQREIMQSEDGLFYLPWITTENTGVNELNIQIKDIHPLSDKTRFSNKIISLDQQKEILSYVRDHNQFDLWYLQPGTEIGIDYSLYPAGENDYLLERIEIKGEAGYPSEAVEVSLYDGADLLYQTRESIRENDSLVIRIPAIPFPDNLFLVVANKGYNPVSIYRERGGLDSIYSNRMYVKYSGWQVFESRDLAIELHLRKRD